MATISNTAGGSGTYQLGQISGSTTLFTTPNVANAIFMVYIIKQAGLSSANRYDKIMVGPNTPVRYPDNNALSGDITWNWTQMEIS